MTTHFPTARELRAESAAARILAEQATATDAFFAAVRAAQDAIAALDFPLGSPVAGYDVADVTGALADWLSARDARDLAALAEDAVLDAFQEAA